MLSMSLLFQPQNKKNPQRLNPMESYYPRLGALSLLLYRNSTPTLLIDNNQQSKPEVTLDIASTQVEQQANQSKSSKKKYITTDLFY